MLLAWDDGPLQETKRQGSQTRPPHWSHRHPEARVCPPCSRGRPSTHQESGSRSWYRSIEHVEPLRSTICRTPSLSLVLACSILTWPARGLSASGLPLRPQPRSVNACLNSTNSSCKYRSSIEGTDEGVSVSILGGGDGRFRFDHRVYASDYQWSAVKINSFPYRPSPPRFATSVETSNSKWFLMSRFPESASSMVPLV